MSDPTGFGDEAVVPLNEILYLAVGRHSSPQACCRAIAYQQGLAGDPQAPGAVGSRRRPKAERSCRMHGGEQRPPGRGLVLRLKSELLEPFMKEDGRSEKGLDVGEPATRARETREFVERAEKLPSKCEANRDGQETVGMERDHEVIVEVEGPDRVAETNGRAVGELEPSVTAPNLDPGRRPHLRRCGVQPVERPMEAVGEINRPTVSETRDLRRRHRLFTYLIGGASGFIGIGRHWSEMHLNKRKSISAIWTSDGAADAILLRSSPVHAFVHHFRSSSWMCKSRS